jgi:hypothetical protein
VYVYLRILSHILAPVSQRVGRACVCKYTCVCVCVYLYILSHILTPVSQRVRKELALGCVCVCVYLYIYSLSLSLYLYILSHILTPVSQRVRKELALAPPSSIAPHVFNRLISGRTGGLVCAKKKTVSIWFFFYA